MKFLDFINEYLAGKKITGSPLVKDGYFYLKDGANWYHSPFGGNDSRVKINYDVLASNDWCVVPDTCSRCKGSGHEPS